MLFYLRQKKLNFGIDYLLNSEIMIMHGNKKKNDNSVIKYKYKFKTGNYPANLTKSNLGSLSDLV